MLTFTQHIDSLDTISDESKQKVCIITDMAKLGKLIGYGPMSTKTFDKYYDLSIKELEIGMKLMQEQYEKKQFSKMFYHGSDCE